ncbi:MAG: ABC transporter permease [Ruminococcus sp.]|nr:ABC transporter permease [Ruminococcus sp.]
MKQNTKEQKISPMRYVRNNKRRVSVLIVSLCLCFAIIYVANFLIMSTDATARKIWVDSMENSCDIGFSLDNLDVSDEDFDTMETSELIEKMNSKYKEYAKKLEEDENIIKAIPFASLNLTIKPPIGMLVYNIPMIDPENADILMKHNGAKLIEGKLPEKPYEIIIDKATMLNNNFKVGDKYNDKFTITGMLECDIYFGYGIIPDTRYVGLNVLTKKRIDDAKVFFSTLGLEYVEGSDFVNDYNTFYKDYEIYVVDEMQQSTKYIYIGIFVLLFVSLFVVYTTYLRDRHNEWCLYCSIGYSRRSIYLSIMGELLFTFITAILSGVIITAVMVIALDMIIMKPKGITCQYFYPDKITEILCAFVLFIGLLQIPIKYALYKIRTIDAMEDDLY